MTTYTLITQINFQGVVRVLYRQGNVYREVIHTSKFDACGVASKGTENKMIKQLIGFIGFGLTMSNTEMSK